MNRNCFIPHKYIKEKDSIQKAGLVGFKFITLRHLILLCTALSINLGCQSKYNNRD